MEYDNPAVLHGLCEQSFCLSSPAFIFVSDTPRMYRIPVRKVARFSTILNLLVTEAIADQAVPDG